MEFSMDSCSPNLSIRKRTFPITKRPNQANALSSQLQFHARKNPQIGIKIVKKIEL